jgi:hypothetical protein
MSTVAIVAIVAVAIVVLLAGGVLLLGGPEARERTADLAAELWDWLRLGR